MIHDGEREMLLALTIRFNEEITAPDAVEPHGSGESMLQLPSRVHDCVLVLSAGLRPIGLTHRQLSAE